MMKCHPANGDTVMRGSPRISWSTGDAMIFNEDMTNTTFCTDTIEPTQDRIDQAFNLSAMHRCRWVELPAI